ncbi:hypothetical protein D3C84_456900 [compost metagenome]
MVSPCSFRATICEYTDAVRKWYWSLSDLAAATGSSAIFTNSATVASTDLPVAFSIDRAASAISTKLPLASFPLPARVASTSAAAPVVPTVALT